jgi:branched-chain amino acid transport system permease protein
MNNKSKKINTGTIESARQMFTRLGIFLLLMGSFPFWAGSIGLYEYIGIEIIIWCIYGLGYNIALGYTGMTSMGQGAYFGLGAYAMAIYQVNFGGSNLIIGLFWAIAAAAIGGIITGFFISNRRGIYISLITIAIGQIFWFSAIKMYNITGGEDGLLNLKRLPLKLGSLEINLTRNTQLFYFCLIVFAIVAILSWRLIRSPFGTVIQAIRQNEERTLYAGYNVRFFKWLSFTISAAVSGLAGGMLALAQQSSYPDVMNLQWSGIIVMIVIIGGGFISFWGPVIGTIYYFIARDLIGAFTPAWMLWFGLSFMLLIIFKPEGIVGLVQDLFKKSYKRHTSDVLDKNGTTQESC